MSNKKYSRDDLLTLFAGTKDAEGQLKATCEAVNLKPTQKSFTQAEGDAVSMARDWINSGECEDYEQVAKKWQQFLEEDGRLEKAIVITPNNRGLLSTINKQGDALYDDIPDEIASQKVQLKGAIGNAILGRLDQRLKEGDIDERIEDAVKKLESQQAETFDQKLNKLLGLPPSG